MKSKITVTVNLDTLDALNLDPERRKVWEQAITARAEEFQSEASQRAHDDVTEMIEKLNATD